MKMKSYPISALYLLQNLTFGMRKYHLGMESQRGFSKGLLRVLWPPFPLKVHVDSPIIVDLAMCCVDYCIAVTQGQS